jgi:hypothetical protein
MKKFLVLMVMTAFSVIGFGQTINNTPISSLNAEYIEIVGTAKVLKPMEVLIHVDYGQISRISEIKNGWVLDQNGQPLSFNGIMGAVNFFNQYGYVLIETFLVTESSGLVYHYIMKKEN